MVALNRLCNPIYKAFNGLYVAVHNVLVIVIGSLAVAVQTCGGIPVATIIAECTRRLLGLSIGSFVPILLFTVLGLASFIPSIWLIGATFAFVNDKERPMWKRRSVATAYGTGLIGVYWLAWWLH